MRTAKINGNKMFSTPFNKLTLFVVALGLTGIMTVSCSSNENENTTGNSAYEQPADEGASSTESTSPTETATANPMDDLGIGPVTAKIEIPATIDAALAEKGKTLFEAKCTACHNPTDQKKVGPGLKGVTSRQRPEWIMNMILNPSEMTQKDPFAKELLATYIAQMANQSLTQDEARAVYEYFRRNDAQ